MAKMSALLSSWREFLIILSVAGVLTFGYVQRVHVPNLDSRFELHDQIVRGEGPSPYRYRILIPLIAEACAQPFELIVTHRQAIRIAYIGIDLTLVFSLLAGLYFYCRKWFSRTQSMVGMLFVASTMPVALTNHWLAPWSLLEPIVMTLALWIVDARKVIWLLMLIAVALLNRETAVILPFVYLVGTIQWRPVREIIKTNRAVLVRFIAMVILCVAILAGMRLVLGSTTHVTDLAQNFQDNLSYSFLIRTALYVLLFLGAFGLFAFRGLRVAPNQVRRSALVIPIYLVMLAPFAVWWEVRVLMTLYPIIVPLALADLFSPQSALAEAKQG